MKSLFVIYLVAGCLTLFAGRTQAATACNASDFDDLMPLLEAKDRTLDVLLYPGQTVSLSRDGPKIEMEVRSPVAGRMIIASLWSTGPAAVYPGPGEDDIVATSKVPFRKSFYASGEGSGAFLVIIWPRNRRFPLDCGPFSALGGVGESGTNATDDAPHIAWGKVAYQIAP